MRVELTEPVEPIDVEDRYRQVLLIAAVAGRVVDSAATRLSRRTATRPRTRQGGVDIRRPHVVVLTRHSFGRGLTRPDATP